MWQWRHVPNGVYATKTAYEKLTRKENQGEDPNAKKAYKSLWNCCAPNRVKAIVWKTLKQRMSTKVELKKRVEVANSDITCTLCGKEEETVEHVLFTCEKSWSVWTRCYQWTKVCMVPQSTPVDHLLQHCLLLVSTSCKKISATIWTAIVWAIWTKVIVFKFKVLRSKCVNIRVIYFYKKSDDI